VRRTSSKSMLTVVVAGLLAFGSFLALAQEKPADTMQILKDKVKADKKLVVAVNVGLTEAEAKEFWPVYEAYQKDLETINRRLGELLRGYAVEYRGNTLSDTKAEALLAESIAIEESEVALKKAYIPRFSKVLPAKKVARYIQIENKIRAVLKYDLAQQIPLAK